MPVLSASNRIRFSKTVLPTPRSPTMSRLFAARAARILSRETAAFSIRSPRPANSGGGVPAPGAYGFFLGSMYSNVILVYVKRQNYTNFTQYPAPTAWGRIIFPWRWPKLAPALQRD